MADFNGIHIGTVWEALQRLSKLAPRGTTEVSRYLKRIIDDPLYRRQVWEVMTGKLVVTGMTKEEWIDRESNALQQMGINFDTQILEKAWQEGFTPDHYFLPCDLSYSQFLEIAERVGIKLCRYTNTGSAERGFGEKKLQTEQGVLECDLSNIMTPTDSQYRPFSLNYWEQEAWTKEQGGEGLTSAEETIYLLIRSFLHFNKIHFMSSDIRSRNYTPELTQLGGSKCNVEVKTIGSGLRIGHGELKGRYAHVGAISRKFIPIG